MDRHGTSLHPPQPPLYVLAPSMPVRDTDDARQRAHNYRASMNCCPSSWQTYFEVQASEIEREWN